MIPELLQSGALAPVEKFRGRRRYFRKVRAEAAAFELEVAADSWWDLWHYHADWLGRGNDKWKYRLAHLQALATVFRRVARRAPESGRPFQAWILLSGRDAGQDGVYLHSPNPGGAPYPVRPTGVVQEDDPRLRPLGARLLPEFDMRAVQARSFDEYAEPPGERSTFFLYAVGVGEPVRGYGVPESMRYV